MSAIFKALPITITVHPPGIWTPDAIKAYRQDQGWTQQAFANILGYESHVTISQWERGHHQVPAPICRLLDIFTRYPDALELFIE